MTQTKVQNFQLEGGLAEDTVQTTDATVTDITTLSIASGSSVGFEIFCIGREAATGDTQFTRILGAIRNQGGTTALVGALNTDVVEDAGAVAWGVTVSADDTADELQVEVTGEAAHTIDWTSRITVLVQA